MLLKKINYWFHFICSFFKANEASSCEHSWWVYSTALSSKSLEVYCMNCGLLGSVENPTAEEWGAAYYAPSCSYPWKEKHRVNYSVTKESNEPTSNIDFKKLYAIVSKIELVSSTYFETKSGNVINASGNVEIPNLEICSFLVFPKNSNLSPSDSELVAKELLAKIEIETGIAGFLQLNRNPEMQIGYYVKIM